MRSPTRSDVKWLVNQAAALAGELSRLDVEARLLAERRAAVEKERHACVRTLSIITGPSALTAVLPTVRVHRPYGGRGKLRQFLHDLLRDSAPASLDSNELAFRAIAHFDLTFASPSEFYRFKNNSIGRGLRQLEREGYLEYASRRYAGAGGFSQWRWKQETLTLHMLAAVKARTLLEG
jgi:hypothetical protein